MLELVVITSWAYKLHVVEFTSEEFNSGENDVVPAEISSLSFEDGDIVDVTKESFVCFHRID